LNETIAKLDKDIDAIDDWARRNVLKLNPTKTKLLILGRKNILSAVNTPFPNSVILRVQQSSKVTRRKI